MNPWRIIYSKASHGAWNMAVDEAILEAAGRGSAPTTLRLYAWEPPCLSLGMAQPFSDVDRAALSERGWGLVRRPTGGRAILHTDELTYSICGPQSEPCLAGGVLESYRRIAAALLQALHYLGVPAVSDAIHSPGGSPAGEGDRPASNGIDPVCFVEPSNYEITAGGKKLIGSAQARRAQAVLQHGSLPLTGDLGRIVQALKYPHPAAREEAAHRLSARATTLEQALGKAVSWESAAAAMHQAFSQVLGVDLVTGELTPTELHRAKELVLKKYANLEWTARV